MITLANVKAMIPVDCDAYDTEINMLMAAAKDDLYNHGVRVFDGGSLVDVAIATYVKKNFHNPPDYEALCRSYESQLSALRFASATARGDDE